jgi:hypothetical protein
MNQVQNQKQSPQQFMSRVLRLTTMESFTASMD